MDSDFWTYRLAAAKRQYNLQQQSSRLDRLDIDDSEVENEVRPDFPCPFCYEEFDIVALCSHLEDEHPCESKVAICPVCSKKVSRDMLSHIMLQHGHLFKISLIIELCTVSLIMYLLGKVESLGQFPLTKDYLQRRHRLRKVAVPNSQALSLLGRDLREAHLQVLLGGGAYRSSSASTNVSNAATDPLLSSLILNFPASEAEELTKSVVNSVEDIAAKNVTPTHMWKSSFDPSLSNEERGKRIQQARGRAGFVQDLVLSTLLNNEQSQ
ncbi:drought-induced protein19 [Hibiscus trionum]|uniref:Drought-induced protein19 n=1 Tax=Hibiscus trionum TaxID=183268 RepID=A0A9W7H8D0_HIBTR|nr:drought-induced protein19 [Hibiscus trionum]